jgi:hypothetical protein
VRREPDPESGSNIHETVRPFATHDCPGVRFAVARVRCLHLLRHRGRSAADGGDVSVSPLSVPSRLEVPPRRLSAHSHLMCHKVHAKRTFSLSADKSREPHAENPVSPFDWASHGGCRARSPFEHSHISQCLHRHGRLVVAHSETRSKQVYSSNRSERSSFLFTCWHRCQISMTRVRLRVYSASTASLTVALHDCSSSVRS